MDTKICQKCAMPMEDISLMGTNADGSRNGEYCTYCFQKGEFTSEVTMEEMVEICVPHMVQAGMEEEAARTHMRNILPTLKGWQNN